MDGWIGPAIYRQANDWLVGKVAQASKQWKIENFKGLGCSGGE